MIRQVDVDEVKSLLESPEPPLLLDVREPEEYAIAHLPGCVLIPLGELASRVREVPDDRPIIVYCHHGVRSLHAAMFLKQSGIEDVASMRGGIDAWSLQIDPSVKRY